MRGLVGVGQGDHQTRNGGVPVVQELFGGGRQRHLASSRCRLWVRRVQELGVVAVERGSRGSLRPCSEGVGCQRPEGDDGVDVVLRNDRVEPAVAVGGDGGVAVVTAAASLAVDAVQEGVDHHVRAGDTELAE